MIKKIAIVAAALASLLTFTACEDDADVVSENMTKAADNFEIDHIGTDKFMSVGQMISQNYGLEAIKREIAKCEIVCANCHKIRTSTRGNHWRFSRQNTTVE